MKSAMGQKAQLQAMVKMTSSRPRAKTIPAAEKRKRRVCAKLFHSDRPIPTLRITRSPDLLGNEELG
jgi:hypothetical protein